MVTPTENGRRTRCEALWALAGLALAHLGCGSDSTRIEAPAAEPEWSSAIESRAALLSVHGTTSDDVWLVGADDGDGPLALHWDGARWQRAETGVRGNLWWVHAFAGGPAYVAGSDGMVLRSVDGAFERLPTPGLGKDIVFGIWGDTPDDLYAVGTSAGRNGFIWHFDGSSWRDLELPGDIPRDAQHDVPGFFKVWGRASDDVWVVGADGVILRGNAADGFRWVPSEVTDTLFTVHAAGDRVAIVGGEGNGVILEADADAPLAATHIPGAPLLQGVCAFGDDQGWAVGAGGSIFERRNGAWNAVETGLPLQVESLHAVWSDPAGGVWAVGGNVLTPALDGGAAVTSASATPQRFEPAPPPPPSCPADAIDPFPGASVARRWNEQILNAIRRDLPRPTVHARNLFHTSIAMWDAWAAYDASADGYLVRERHDAPDPPAARAEALSYAAYRVLSHRYGGAVGGPTSLACFDAMMEALGYDPSDTRADGDDPRSLGNRIGRRIIESFAADGANEAEDYADPDAFEPDNPRLVVDRPGTTMANPTLWQRLVLAQAVTQNGIPEASGSPAYIGAQWGNVAPFALVRPEAGAPYLDIGQAPTALDDELVDQAVDIIRKTAELDVEDGVRMDISPGVHGNNPLGEDDGTGHAINPTTGEPYAPNPVLRGDFRRVMAEYWADGPNSETPPGHWNTIANAVADHPEFQRRLFGAGAPLDALAWDVHVYLALNGAVHDAAIAAWELKRRYVSARPISLIRYLGGLGQRTSSTQPAYAPNGIALEPGLIEPITDESTSPGARHAHLRRYVGEIAVRSWRGEPGDRERDVGGIAWIRAKDWVPYQRRTFVTPAFPGYVSGHSTFSRAAAEALASLTGSPFFPGGMASSRREPGYLVFEHGPQEPVELQWATYFDAADQAGQSRLWGGIHMRSDDLDGRRIGARVGLGATARARAFFDGTAVP